jgi:hypothetical protein
MENTNNERVEQNSLKDQTEKFVDLVRYMDDEKPTDMEDFLTSLENNDAKDWAVEKEKYQQAVRKLRETNVLNPKIQGTKKFRFSYFNYIVHRKLQFEKFVDCLAERGFMFEGWRDDTVVLNILYNRIKHAVIDYIEDDYNVSLIADIACSLLSPEWLFSNYGEWDRSGNLINGHEELEFISDRLECISYIIDGPIAITFSESFNKIKTVIENKNWSEHNGTVNDSNDKCIIQQIYTSDDPRYWDQC